MRIRNLPIAVAALALAGGLAAAPASAAGYHHALFVQTNLVAGNTIEVYDVGGDGALTPAGKYATGGRGGVEINSEPDALTSQDALTYLPENNLLLAVNAGSDTVSVFRVVDGDRLVRTQILSSEGEFPVSVIARGNLVYVLNSGGTGSVASYRIVGGGLVALPGGSASLGLHNTNPPSAAQSARPSTTRPASPGRSRRCSRPTVTWRSPTWRTTRPWRPIGSTPTAP